MNSRNRVSEKLDWESILHRTSFIELSGRQRAYALLDQDTDRCVAQELCGPFDRIISPWLLDQQVVPQSDDGVIVVRGCIAARPVVVISVEQRFNGGGIGEVSGTKISQALRLAAQHSHQGIVTPAIILLETGGVRLQEANLGLAAIAEICDALLDLRSVAPVIGIIAGQVGCFGGMSIVAGLCSSVIMTEEGRLGLSGPLVIEQEAGISECDASDRHSVWSLYGGKHRYDTAAVDVLVPDDLPAIRHALDEQLLTSNNPVSRGCRNDSATHMRTISGLSPQLAEQLSAIAQFSVAKISDNRLGRQQESLAPQLESGQENSHGITQESAHGEILSGSSVAPNVPHFSRGERWITALCATTVAIIPSVRYGVDLLGNAYLSVIPDEHNYFPRAQAGELGLTQALALTQALNSIIDAGNKSAHKQAIIAIVDVPSQAYGVVEERFALHQLLANVVDAYYRARMAGHPVIALVVGKALAGAFLAHGMQAQRILALDDPGVMVHAMGKTAAARVTRRSVTELDHYSENILPMSYDVRAWAQLGICTELLSVSNADHPSAADINKVHAAIIEQSEQIRGKKDDLSYRQNTCAAQRIRKATHSVITAMTQQWHDYSCAYTCQ